MCRVTSDFSCLFSLLFFFSSFWTAEAKIGTRVYFRRILCGKEWDRSRSSRVRSHRECVRCVRWPRALYFLFFFFFFFFHKEERSTEYLLLMSEHRETIFKQCSQPSTDNAASLKASLIERKKELYISTYVYMFLHRRDGKKNKLLRLIFDYFSLTFIINAWQLCTTKVYLFI